MRRPLIDLAGLAVVLVVLAFAGRMFNVGPLSSVVPPAQVTDPGEMLARSLQAVLDASAVHVAVTMDGTIPGALAGRPGQTVDLAGTVVAIDLRPHDAATRLHVESPSLAAHLDTVTSWDTAWYRTAADGAWTKGSIGVLSAGWGIDINPLTLVDRLRAYLATADPQPTATDVDCASASGICHHIELAVGEEAGALVGAVLPEASRAALPPLTMSVNLDTDASTLQPAHLDLDITSDDGTLHVHVALDASRWDGPVVIEAPGGS